MHFEWVKQAAGFLSPVFANQLADTEAFDGSINAVKQVAIIGAGAAGASTAYHLHKFAAAEGIELNVTIFEKTSHIGGRSLTVNAYDDPLQPVELGASIFVEVNHILWNATNDFNLTRVDPGADEKGTLAIWDGYSFVYEQDSDSWGWWNLAKLFWKYGTAPYYTDKLVKQVINTFLKLYERPYFPFRSLSTRAFELGLTAITGVTGEQFLAQNKLGGAFAHDIVQAASRVNYASNLAYIHGVGAMVSMAPEGAVSVLGGNWQMFARMVESSQAHVQLDTAVTSIAEVKSKDPLAPASRFSITSSSKRGGSEVVTKHPFAFDNVVIAAPYQFSGIKTEDNLIQHPIDEIPYVKLHVTLFASPFRFSPEFFNLPAGTKTPTAVLTTLAEGEDPKSGSEGAGHSGFYSASLVKVVTNPKTENKEFVYKIFSPAAVTPEFLSKLLGVTIPETFTGAVPSSSENASSGDADGESTVVEPISWYHPAVFHPYPQKLPRVTFQDPILRDGLYYTSGIESFISTMETSALMGMNVARLIVDDLASSAPVASISDDEDIVVVEVPAAAVAEDTKVEEVTEAVPATSEISLSEETVPNVEL
ncbi:prenylcysteine oxidase [Microdochium trichocladiopsis]|uniref:Prenylcysteine oxidase n=1 Tax=Microdochium trichocladiopsis TaxID=1682393 RepID=A0A9P8Y3S6_9PEZI|nr:prenylcysteine oxidase [Microdochium trichocladiopsis]KAH7029057.1 prenylcysteine oxidase [Microdochium trichocladiopsis]